MRDGSLLFLLHLIAKMRPAVDGDSRFGMVLNGSPLFTGGAGSGESEIRRYVLKNDLGEAIIGLPTDMFHNTGISTYVWIVSNRKPAARKGKRQLIDASSFWQKMGKALGSKREELSPAHIEDITRLFGNFEESIGDGVPISRIFTNDGILCLDPQAGVFADEVAQRIAVAVEQVLKAAQTKAFQGFLAHLPFLSRRRRDSAGGTAPACRHNPMF